MLRVAGPEQIPDSEEVSDVTEYNGLHLNSFSRPVSLQSAQDSAYCKEAVENLVLYSFKGMYQATLDIYTNRQANSAARSLARKVNVELLRQRYPFNNVILDRSDAQVNTIIDTVCRFTMETLGMAPMTEAALSPLNWVERLWAIPTVPMMLNSFVSNTITMSLRPTNLLSDGDGLTGERNPTFRSDFQWAIMIFNGACYIDYNG